MAAAAAASSAASLALPFTPRAIFDASPSITRTYFLGHHRAALTRMRAILSNIGLVIECRDLRVPLSSWNPLLESALASPDRARIVVYTHRDLAPSFRKTSALLDRLRAFHAAGTAQRADAVLFLGRRDGAARLLAAVKAAAAARPPALTGLRALVVGMPNAGKSTLLNALRARGVGGGKAAATGAQPGVTRKLGTPVRVVAAGEGADGNGGGGVDGGVYVLDTPGVSVPYVPDAHAMLRLALVGSVKDGVVPAVTVADFLLYHLNLVDPDVYARYCAPTNDVHVFLEGVARRTGKLDKGGVPSLESAAGWVIQEWRKGELGHMILDEVTDETLDMARRAATEPPLSFNQARKREKEARKAKSLAKLQAAV